MRTQLANYHQQAAAALREEVTMGIRFNPNSSWITISAAVSAIGFAVVCTWIVSGQLSDINRQFAAMQLRMDSLEESIGDKYTIARASENALRMALENPGLRVPDPRNPTDLFEVKSASSTSDNAHRSTGQ